MKVMHLWKNPIIHQSINPKIQQSIYPTSVERFDHHIFICTNERPPDSPKGSCAAKGSLAIADKFKEELHRRGLKARVRANKAGCLDACERGPSVVIYPEGIWYQRVSVEDVNEIIESHLIGGKPVERLRVPLSTWNPSQPK